MRTGSEIPPDIYRRSQPECQVIETTILCPCGIEFIPSQYNQQFHELGCHDKWHNARSGKYRTTTTRLRNHLEELSRRGFLKSSVGAIAVPERFLGGTETARREAIYESLLHLNRLMREVGPVNPGVRHEMRTGAEGIFVALGPAPTSVWERVAAASAWEVLRDAGIEAPLTAEKVYQWLHASVMVQRFFLERGIFTENIRKRLLVQAMICHGNIFRFLETQSPVSITKGECRRMAKRMLTGARNTLSGLDVEIPVIAQLAHQIEFREAIPGKYFPPNVVERKIERLEVLNNNAHDARVSVEHYREAAGLAGRLKYDRGRVAYCTHQMNLCRQKLEKFTSYADPTLLTPTIAGRFESVASGAHDEAVHIAETAFSPLYRENPHLYYGAKLRAWLKKDIVVADQYASAFIAFFDRLDPEKP